MKKFLITFLLLFLVVQFVDAGSLLPSKVYAEDGFHCGKYIDVQILSDADVQILSDADVQILSDADVQILSDADVPITLLSAAILTDNNFIFGRHNWQLIEINANSQIYTRVTAFRRARDGLTEDRVILVC